jgi:cobalt/nickel transport system permease protein
VGGRHAHAPGAPAGDPDSAIHRLDPRAKLGGLLGVTVVGVTTPLAAWPVWVCCGAVLVALAAVARVPPAEVWWRARVVLPAVLLAAAFVPLARAGEEAFALGPLSASVEGLEVLLAVAVKATIGTVSAVLLLCTTSVPALLRALEALRVPRLLTLTAAFAYRYLFVVAAELGRMRGALRARAYHPRTPLALAPLGRIAGALFLRSYARGERVYLAMLARGYTGAMPGAAPLRLVRADVVFLAAVALALLPLRAAVGLAA